MAGCLHVSKFVMLRRHLKYRSGRRILGILQSNPPTGPFTGPPGGAKSDGHRQEKEPYGSCFCYSPQSIKDVFLKYLHHFTKTIEQVAITFVYVVALSVASF